VTATDTIEKKDLVCPRDGASLGSATDHGIHIDRCPTCGGAWYDFDELALLEATVADDDASRAGMIEYARRPSELPCPVCARPMQAFNYRAHNLELDACIQEHGFWLDEGEARRVREVMKDRANGLRRADSAQAAWDRARRGGGGIMDQIRGMFGGRR
jgi:Zn-finger nucleic acid-binding protein